MDPVFVVHYALDGTEDVAEPAGVAFAFVEDGSLRAPVSSMKAEHLAAGVGPAGFGGEDLFRIVPFLLCLSPIDVPFFDGRPLGFLTFGSYHVITSTSS
jgi:hypothetical protein